MSDEVRVKVSVDDNQAVQAFIKLEKGASNFTSNFVKGIGFSDRAFDVFKGNIAANVMAGAFNLMTDAAKQLFDVFIVNGIDSAIEFEDTVQTLNVALKSTGQFTNKLSQDLQDLAQSTQETTKYSDSMVLSATTQLQTLARLSGEGLMRATTASIDLAAALKIDLTSAAELVAKAHEGQTSALKRNGIVINENIPVTERYAEALKVIETRFGGTAQAQAVSYAARVEILKNQFDDTIKSFGFFITKNEGVGAVLKVTTDILKDFTKNLTGGKTASDELTQSIVYTATIIAPLAQLADGFGRVFMFAFRGAAVVVDSFAIVVNRVLIGMVGGVDLVYKALAIAMPEAFGESSKGISKFVSDFSKQTDLLTKNVGNHVQKMGQFFTEETALEKFAERAKKAAIQIQAEIANMSARPKEIDQAPKKEEQTEASKQYAIDEATKQADITKIIQEAQAERDVSDAQLRIAIGEGRMADIIEIQNYEAQKIAITLASELEKANLVQDSAKKSQLKAKANADAELAQVRLSNKSKVDIKKQELADQETFLNTAATLSNAKNKELAAIGKAAAITQIAIKTPPAIASSFEFGTKLGGPPLGFAFGGIAAVAMAAQAASIAGVKFEQGGIVPGLGQYGDQVQARLNPGEVVLNNTQQQELLNVANGRSNNGNSNMLASLVDAIQNQVISINVDGREIARVVRDQKAAGFAI